MTWNQILGPLLTPTSLSTGPGGLKTIPTTSLTVPVRAQTIVGTAIYFHQLRAGTDVESSPTIIWPTDYNAGTNAKVWELIKIGNASLSDIANYDNREQRIGASQCRRPRPGIYCDGNAAAKGTCGSPAAFGTGNFTVAFSLLLASYTPGSAVTIFASDTDGTNDLQILLNTGGSFVVRIVDSSNHDFILTPDVALVGGTPYDFCISVTRSGNAVLYVNGLTDRNYDGTGVSVSVAAQSATDISSAPETVMAFGNNLNGVIYSLRLYTRALSAAEALALAITGVVDHADILSGCILDVDFDFANPSQSTTVRDRSSNSRIFNLVSANTTQTSPIKQLNVVSAITIGGLSQLKGMISVTASLNFASIAAAASADLTITATGAAVGDTVALGLPSAPTAGIIYMAFVSATNTVTVRATNITAGAIDPASQTFRVSVFQF